MRATTRLFCATAALAFTLRAGAADVPKDSPFGQAGTQNAGETSDDLQFAGVSVIGKKTMVDLYNPRDKTNFWVQEGKTVNGVTVVKYDSAHDQVTIRRSGAEKILPLRPPGTVVNTPVTALPPATPSVTAEAPAAPNTPPAPPATQARQEEEARMLVSDLLEIGMAQRRAYEEAQKKAAGQSGQPANAQPGQSDMASTGQTAPAATAGQPAASGATSTPSSAPTP